MIKFVGNYRGHHYKIGFPFENVVCLWYFKGLSSYITVTYSLESICISIIMWTASIDDVFC